MKKKLLNRVENIVAKVENAQFEQFLSTTIFSNIICCRGIKINRKVAKHYLFVSA